MSEFWCHITVVHLLPFITTQLMHCPCFDRIILLPLTPEASLEESRGASVKHLIKKSVWSFALLTFMEESLVMPDKYKKKTLKRMFLQPSTLIAWHSFVKYASFNVLLTWRWRNYTFNYIISYFSYQISDSREHLMVMLHEPLSFTSSLYQTSNHVCLTCRVCTYDVFVCSVFVRPSPLPYCPSPVPSQLSAGRSFNMCLVLLKGSLLFYLLHWSDTVVWGNHWWPKWQWEIDTSCPYLCLW